MALLCVVILSLLLLLASASDCAIDVLERLSLNEQSPESSSVSFRIHHNGEAEPCGTTSRIQLASIRASVNNACGHLDKYDVEALLTQVVSDNLEQGACKNEIDPNPTPGFLGYCDRGEDFTPILLDHNRLIKVKGSSLPCRFFTREGLRISSLSQLDDLAEECLAGGDDDDDGGIVIDLYAVSAGRVFMFAPKFVGEIFELPHVVVDEDAMPIYLEVLNLRPRVFDIFHFFSKDESDDLVRRALAETSPSHRIKRSTTGTTEYSVFEKRTSENGFDTHGRTAQKVKRRCLSALGFDEYIEGHTDGLQILRYNETKAYIPHMDYMTDRTGQESHDYDSVHKGGNRYATILLYMSDMGEKDGGETVFSDVYPPLLPDSERRDLSSAIRDLRASGDASLLKRDSWEESMVATCRSRLSVRPNSARAVLFYSQHPDGREDPMSKHGGCPVLNGVKWAANLWVWNTPREGFTGSPVKKHMAAAAAAAQQATNQPTQLKAIFVNSGKDPAFAQAELYYDESGYWGKIGHGDKPLVAYTYEGHRWNIMVEGKFVKQFIIAKKAVQEFTI